MQFNGFWYITLLLLKIVVKLAVLTIFTSAVERHSVHSECRAASPAVCFENFSSPPPWQASNLKHRIHVLWGFLAAQAFWRTLGGSPRVPVKIRKEYGNRESMALWFLHVVIVSFGRHFVFALSLQPPPLVTSLSSFGGIVNFLFHPEAFVS